MPKYMIKGSYTAEGLKGLMKDGGTKRVKAVSKLLKSVGARLDACYFAMGDADVYAIFDAPDNVTAAAMSMAVNASGAVQLQTIVLLSPEEMDKAAKTKAAYTPPGR